MTRKQNKKDQVPCWSISLLVSQHPVQVEVKQHSGAVQGSAAAWESRVQRVVLKMRDKSFASTAHPIDYMAVSHTFVHTLDLRLPCCFMLSFTKLQLDFEQKETPNQGDAMCQWSLYPFLCNVYSSDIWAILISPCIQTVSPK